MATQIGIVYSMQFRRYDPGLLRCIRLIDRDLEHNPDRTEAHRTSTLFEEKTGMSVTLIVTCVVVLSLLIVIWTKRTRDGQGLETHSITPEALHTLLASNQEVLLVDVRQPLDMLADSEIIVGATRIPPKELLQNPSLIPKDQDSVVYCTCPDDKTSRIILRRAQAMNFLRVKFLRGGLAGWKAKGYPVEPYEKSFHLDTRT
jgi:rhodanese-related sulfurtransferase